MSERDGDDGLAPGVVDAFIARWEATGGNEDANAQPFLTDLCALLGVPRPDPAKEENYLNDYAFERSVTRNHADGHVSTRFLDLYKRGCFVLEAKQSSRSGKVKPTPAQRELHGTEAGDRKLGTAKRGTNAWVTAMRKAREQAEGYAKDLPPEHGWPPFLIVCDVGYCFEIYADFSGQGKNYAHFPDRRGFRILLEDLRLPDVRERLRTIWTAPHDLDPAQKSARVTRDIAKSLAAVALELEKRHDAETVAMFLMRCLFTMFAEDVELLKKDSFTNLLGRLQSIPDRAHLALEQLWEDMNTGSPLNGWIEEKVRKFNGGLFKDAKALPLTADMVADLTLAAKCDWRDVEPSIFGTLLEQALDKKERHKLGAHYTPRSYVERLVTPTIIEPLREDWRDVMVECQALIDAGKGDEARDAARRFHESLCDIRVLDPACGTGNFLYVAMEMMKKLEGDVVDFITELGGEATLEFRGHTVDPHQFLGIELNPRAAAIAELVLWIGFIKWQLKTGGQDVVVDPVLRDFHNIECRDAVLDHAGQTLRLGEDGKPLSRWDGETMKTHPVTGEPVPDESARVEIYDYAKPKPAVWPKADFIVGNPPYHGARTIRKYVTAGYIDAVRQAYPEVPENSDYVMYWWHKSALTTGKRGARRFGLVTTNSITQSFNVALVAKSLLENGLHIEFAIPDHPWPDYREAAAVRVAMVVVAPGDGLGVVGKVEEEAALGDEEAISIEFYRGRVWPNLRIGPDLLSAASLKANYGLASVGYQLSGKGFLLSKGQFSTLTDDLAAPIRRAPLLSARDLVQKSRDLWALDATSVPARTFQAEYPEQHQFLADRLRPHRAEATQNYGTLDWWMYARSRPELREALLAASRAIVTPLTAKHRLFVFVDRNVIFDSTTTVIPADDAEMLAILSARVHEVWALAAGGTLEDRPRYNKTRCFDPFPFPDLTGKPALKSRLDELGERLDAQRKSVLARHDFLTMTKLYNVLERVRALEGAHRTSPLPPLDGEGGSARSGETGEVAAPPGGPESAGAATRSAPDDVRRTSPIKGEEATPLTDAERDIYEAGLVGTLKSIHDDIDAAVFEAYGWPSGLDDEAILERLVALNLERHAEESRGQIRWLRPDFQIPRFAPKGTRAAQDDLDLGETAAVAAPGEKLPAFPASDRKAQARIVRELLEAAHGPATADALARRLAGKNTRAKITRVRDMLDVMEALGQAETDEAGRYFVGG
ncbi:DNA methyltransferase [Maricaulis sp.]|uniref:DNA methyltransferase n=1 Tax=Maricaulis sp. TaxID=1486257 RepID=UPI003A935868